MTSRFHPALIALFAVVVLALLLPAGERPVTPPVPLSQELVGVWAHVGEPGNISPNLHAGRRLKFRIGQRWTLTHADANGRVVAHFGGTYRVVGNDYIETIDYSTDPEDSELGSTLRFSVKVEGDTMTQTGRGNPYTEVWRRVP